MRHPTKSPLQAAHAIHAQAASDEQLLRSIEFHDLLKLNRTQVFVNTTLSWPWLILGWFRCSLFFCLAYVVYVHICVCACQSAYAPLQQRRRRADGSS